MILIRGDWLGMFQIGDLITYGNTGVCRITNVTTLDSPTVDNSLLYYVLKPLYQDSTVYTPINNTKVSMRPIITKEEAEYLINMIPSIHAEADHSQALRELTEHYSAMLKTYDCASLIELTMSIYAKKQFLEKQNRKFGAVDERFMKQAEELLFGELAVALGIPIEKVPEYIATRVDEITKTEV